MPVGGTRVASWPRAAPIQRRSDVAYPRSINSAAIDSPGSTCPAVPPPAITMGPRPARALPTTDHALSLAMLSSTPVATSITSRDDPP